MKFWQLILFVLFLSSQTSARFKTLDADSLVAVESVKNLGLSASDERRSVIEMRWCFNEALNDQISLFNLTLLVRYADGALITFDQSVNSNARNHQFEVPTLHFVRGRKPAFIESLKAEVHLVPANTPQQNLSAFKRRRI